MNRLLVVVALASCGPSAPARTPQQRADDSAPAVKTLQAAKFADAQREASTALAKDPGSSRVAAVRAIASYQMAGHELIKTLTGVIEKADKLDFFDHQGGRAAWQAWLTQLEQIDKDLAIVAADPAFSLELCLACWEHDWNRSGEIDDRDRLLFQIEFDGKDGELAETDPRRKPTFRFDSGDAEWARAMLSFQRAFGELVLAYKWSELDNLFFGGERSQITIRITEPARVKRARELVLRGLDHAEKCRAMYLAETDDDREWVPNPRQKNYPMPLEVDAQLYENWLAILGDVRRMLNSEEGLSLRELARIADDDIATRLPAAYIDIGRMLGEPKDIEIDLTAIFKDPDAAAVERLLRGLLGNGYQVQMRASPLVGRLRHMKEQLDRDQDTLGRKLRYLLWLN
jgi:hypothetical protein